MDMKTTKKIITKDTNPAYWDKYTNLQYTKHKLIENYLNGWLPKLSWARRILYFDTHAGRGRHKGGQEGSPLVALNCILNHKHREKILGQCEIFFFFIEIDGENCCDLKKEIKALGKIPRQITVEVIAENCFEKLQAIIEYLDTTGKNLAPAFIFVDPYGFKIPGSILQALMRFDRVELFVNVIWRELGMAISNAENERGLANTLDSIFNGAEWRQLLGLDFEEMADGCLNLLSSKIGAKWSTSIKMLGSNGVTRYMLLHLTNHDAGRDLMKYCMWKVCPDGGFYARATDDPKQNYLITPTPDLTPLKSWVINKLKKKSTRWQDMIEDLKSEIWRPPHLNKIIRELRKEKIIEGRKCGNNKRFVPRENPELFLLK